MSMSRKFNIFNNNILKRYVTVVASFEFQHILMYVYFPTQMQFYTYIVNYNELKVFEEGWV